MQRENNWQKQFEVYNNDKTTTVKFVQYERLPPLKNSFFSILHPLMCNEMNFVI